MKIEQFGPDHEKQPEAKAEKGKWADTFVLFMCTRAEYEHVY